jgi:hypothetical protein
MRQCEKELECAVHCAICVYTGKCSAVQCNSALCYLCVHWGVCTLGVLCAVYQPLCAYLLCTCVS